MDMSKETFHVLYDGPALANHEMDVRDLAPALLALGQVLEEANAAINDGRAKVHVQVRASFKTGCFGIELDLVQSLIQQAQSLFGNDHIASAKTLLEWVGLVVGGKEGVKSLLGFMKWLRGRKIDRIVLLDNGNMKVVLDEESIEIESQVIELFRRSDLRNALEGVLKPLDKIGIDKFAVVNKTQSKEFLVIDKSERIYFIAPAPEPEILAEEEVVMNLQLVNVAFRDDNKWRFSDGNSTFFALVEDVNFLNKVQSNEPFARGDILRARLRRIQVLSGEDMKTEYHVLEVLDHRRSGVQLPMPFSDQ
ncbi:hypothetical protein [Caballeronia glebae]|uniref:hypothetical protein n=1 Tax=Caballeronia glebae TaxID=1777143 RepID=UPI0038BD74AD